MQEGNLSFLQLLQRPAFFCCQLLQLPVRKPQLRNVEARQLRKAAAVLCPVQQFAHRQFRFAVQRIQPGHIFSAPGQWLLPVDSFADPCKRKVVAGHRLPEFQFHDALPFCAGDSQLFPARYYDITFCFICQYNISLCLYFTLNKAFEVNTMYQRIRDLREDRDLLQKDVAAYLKCTQVCYSNYETGKRDIPTEVLIQLAGLYHTSTDYILGLTDDSAPPIPRKA